MITVREVSAKGVNFLSYRGSLLFFPVNWWIPEALESCFDLGEVFL